MLSVFVPSFVPVVLFFFFIHSSSLFQLLSSSKHLPTTSPFLSHPPVASPLPDDIVFLPPPPRRGASVIGAMPVLGQRAAGSGQGALRSGVRPGGGAPVRPPLRTSPRAHPAPASPGGAGPRDAKVHELNTPCSSASLY